MSNKVESIKQNNRKAAHSQKPQTLKTKRQGSGKGGWGDPMDDLKFLDQDSRVSNPADPNYEEDPADLDQATPSAEPSADTYIAEASYFQNFQSDVESLSAFKIKVEELVADYFYSTDTDAFISALDALNCVNFFNQVPKVLLWTVIASKKQEHFPSARKLLQHLRTTNTISKLQLESAFRRLFHRLNELSTLNSNAYLILVDFGEYCVARNLLSQEFLSQLQKQTEFAKDPARIQRLKEHITNVISEFFASGDVAEAVRCISEMDTPFYNHEVVKRMVSAAFDQGNRERELTSQFLARAVGDGDDYPIPRNNCELGFIILLQRVEGLYKDVPDVLELLSAFIGRAMVDEVLPPAFVDHVTLLETDMGYAVIHHVKHLVSGKKRDVDDQLLNVWGANTSRSIKSIKKRIGNILKEYLVSRELDEALTAIQELNVAMFHHEIIKQLVPAVADYYTPKDLVQSQAQTQQKETPTEVRVNVPESIKDKAVQVQLAVDLISTALEHNIMARKQVSGGFKRLRERMSDYKLDCPLIATYYECIAAQFRNIIGEENEEKKEESAKRAYGGAREREVDEEVRGLVAQSKALVMDYAKAQGKEGLLKGDVFEAVSCRTQTVAGLNFFVKVRVGEGVYIHVFVWRKLDASLELLKVEFGCAEKDELVFRREQEVKEEVKQQRRMVCGGAGPREVDDLVRSACERVREAVAERAKATFSEFTPVQACSQVVAGTNLFVKVRVAEGKFVHIRVWCKLDSSVELSAVQLDKAEDDEIAYF